MEMGADFLDRGFSLSGKEPVPLQIDEFSWNACQLAAVITVELRQEE
jgi:hypothetical protein